MNADPISACELAFAIDPEARRVGDHYEVRCLAHDDRHPSLHIKDTADGRILFICRSGCTQAEVLDSLRARGLWKPARDAVHAPRRRFSWLAYVSTSRFTPREFVPLGREYQLAHFRGELDVAAREVRTLYQAARQQMTADDVARELRLSLALGGIDPGLPAPVVEIVIRDFCGDSGAGNGSGLR
jgi:hypothetical protein